MKTQRLILCLLACLAAGQAVCAAAPPDAPPPAGKKDSLQRHRMAVTVTEGWIRDPYIYTIEGQGYVLTGTTRPQPGQGPQRIDTKLRIWQSKDLVQWEYVGAPYDVLEDGYVPPQAEKKVMWAPELYRIGGRWAMVHCPKDVSALAFTSGPDLKGPWTVVDSPDFNRLHDPSLFQDDDGTWYVLHGSTHIAPLKADMSGRADKNRPINPSDHVIGHEGTFMRKIGGKYVLFGTGWSTDQMRRGSYNLYYCVADHIYGPYGPRRFAGRFLGHGTLFQDLQGRWWCTAFHNADRPTLPKEGIEGRDLREAAQTINPQGVTLVPMEVQVLPGGDISIRAKDPHYALPGPDENQQF